MPTPSPSAQAPVATTAPASVGIGIGPEATSTPLSPAPGPGVTLPPTFPRPAGALVTPSPAPTLRPRDFAAIAAMEQRCGTPQPAVAVAQRDFPLAEVTTLADGRSAQELANVVLQARPQCVLYAEAYGEGDSELAILSDYLSTAVFWVDHGWWRAWVGRVGHLTMRGGPSSPTGERDALLAGGRRSRELTLLVDSGGSAGFVGFAVLRIDGPTLTPLVISRTSDSAGTTRLDDDHILMTGRQTQTRPIAWNAHCCWPGGYEWLYERHGDRFDLVAERQAYDTYYVASIFFGGLKAGQTDDLSDVATPAAIAAAAPLFATPTDVLMPLGAGTVADRAEALSWSAIPAALRSPVPTGPLSFRFGFAPAPAKYGDFTKHAQVLFAHRASGWYIDSVVTEP
ncbi:MAG: hypothetical protein KGK07_14165 [Chloroflexota bacterium]|nr:hypothetical protein [Chloroflexota bacterium]